MSASERLRELDRAARDIGLEAGAVRWKLADALPLIADVVEAAEDELRSEECGRTAAALTALTEHLEGDDG